MLLTHTGRLVGQALVLGLLCLPFFASTASSAAEIHSLHKRCRWAHSLAGHSNLLCICLWS